MITEVIQPDAQPRVFDRSVDVIQALNNGQIDGYVVDAPTAYVNVLIGQVENGVVVGQFPEQGEHFGLVFEQDNPLVECVNLAIAALEADGSLQALRDEWLADLTYPVRSKPRGPLQGMSSTPAGAPLPPEPLPTGDRRSRILSGGTRVEGRRAVAIALASTAIFLTVIAVVAVNSAGWGEFSDKFLNWHEFWDSFPRVARAFLVNIELFLIAEVLVLILALGVAVLRSLPGPVFFPIRILAVVYTDLFRGIPTVLVIYTLGFGAPALQIQGVPKSPFFWAVVSLVLVYTAYVAEVYRAGIESVHESQVAAARSLGLTRWQSMRYVVLPQAVRRVIPPLAERLHRPAEGHRPRRDASG